MVRRSAPYSFRPVSADRLIDVLWGDAQVASPVNGVGEDRNRD
jgi:hypothetical protein